MKTFKRHIKNGDRIRDNNNLLNTDYYCPCGKKLPKFNLEFKEEIICDCNNIIYFEPIVYKVIIGKDE